jgi:hypothetical protein
MPIKFLVVMEGATGANLSNFMGQNAGYQATDALSIKFLWSAGLKQQMLIYQISLIVEAIS